MVTSFGGTSGHEKPRGRADYRVGVDAVRLEKVGDIAGLPEAVHAQRRDAMSLHRTQPAQGGRVGVDDRDDTACGRYEQFLKDSLTRIEGVAGIKSSFALREVQYSTALPLVDPVSARARSAKRR